MLLELEARLRSGYFLLLTLSLSSCGTTMQMSAEDLQSVGSEEGIVVGSILISGGKDVLGRTGWQLMAKKTGWKSNLFSKDYSMKADRGQEEETFTAKMPAGTYQFHSLEQTGFSNAEAKLDVRFEVQPESKVYLGRLVIEFPSGLTMTGTRLWVRVEDAREATIAKAQEKYGIPLDDAVTNLMVVR